MSVQGPSASAELSVLESALALLNRERAKLPWWRIGTRYRVWKMANMLERAIDAVTPAAMAERSR